VCDCGGDWAHGRSAAACVLGHLPRPASAVLLLLLHRCGHVLMDGRVGAFATTLVVLSVAPARCWLLATAV
jgi:hypothetical protein